MFGITKNDLQEKISPSESEYEFDAETDIGVTEFASMVSIAEDKILSVIPYKYRNAMEYIDEVLSFGADNNQTVFNLSFSPVVGSVKVYVNFPAKSFSFRRFEDETTNTFTVDEVEKTITFSTPLNSGDRVYAYYKHTEASNFYLLKDMAVTALAIEVSRRNFFHRNSDADTRFEQWGEALNLWQTQMQRGQIGIYQIDAIKQVEDVSVYGNDITNDPLDVLLNIRSTPSSITSGFYG